jgi:membrane protein
MVCITNGALASQTSFALKFNPNNSPPKMTSAKPSIKKSNSQWKLGGMALGQLVRNVLQEIRANNILGRASELAFDFLFALFPLMLFMLTLFGLFASRSVQLQENLLSYLARFLPPVAFQLLNTTVTELAANASGGKLTSSIIIALWLASGGVSSMISALNLAYHVREARSWFKVRAIALGLTLLISFLLLTALFIELVSSYLVDWVGRELRLQPVVVVFWKTIQWPASILFVVASYSVIYYCGPDLKDRHWYWITPGSAFGAFLWELSSLGFRAYLHFSNTYSTLFGSFGAVMILLVWLYVAGLAFLVGGIINAEIERSAREPILE